ncbi:Ccr4 not transcription complex [Fasciola hepatica]|uniref:Ccr4 not transcription complex n=1 Tax=Fasciola hepatica TaxID=6192 RepID=A0A4E0RMH3_FASHE|nr:Ccr4 not transcription complex [Fasciola hepatica]
MLHSGLYQSRNEEFPALTKSQPISFGTTARKIRPSSPDVVTHDSSRKKRVKKKKRQHNVDDGCRSFLCHSDVSVPKLADTHESNSTSLNHLTDKTDPTILKEALVRGRSHSPELDSVHTFRTTDDEGFVDCIADSVPRHSASTAAIVVVASSNNGQNSIQNYTTSLEAVPIVAKSGMRTMPASSNSASTSLSTSTPPPPSSPDNDGKVCSNNMPLCARCEEKCADSQVFGSLELPHLWDSVLPRSVCCRQIPGGDEANVTDRSFSDTVSDACGDSGKTKIPSGTGDHLQFDGGLDDLDEDEVEGTDLLHLISNSLDRFNEIVHPHDLSGLTSGLGASEALLSDLDWLLPDSGNSFGTFKCSKTGTSVEEFTDNHLSWLKSRLTASSCPSSASLASRTISCGPFTSEPPECANIVTSAVTESTTAAANTTRNLPFLSTQCGSSCMDDAALRSLESSSGIYSRPTSLGLTSMTQTVQSKSSEFIPDRMNRVHSLNGSPFEAESVYPSSQSITGRQSQCQLSRHLTNRLTSYTDAAMLDVNPLVTVNNQDAQNLATGFTLPLNTAPMTPWASADNRSFSNLRTTQSEMFFERPITTNAVTTSSVSSNGFLSHLEHSYTSPSSVSNMNRPTWDSLSRGLDWLSMQTGPGMSRGALLSPLPNPSGRTLCSAGNVGGLTSSQPSSVPPPPPGLTTCSSATCSLNTASELDGPLDTTILLSRDPFTVVQRPEAVIPVTSAIEQQHQRQQQQQQQQTIPATVAMTHGSRCGKSVLSTCLTSDFAWNVKGLDAWNSLYPGCDRRPTTTGLGFNRSRLPHSDSVAFANSERCLGTRRASLSTGLAFDLNDLVQSGLGPVRFDSPDPLIAAYTGGGSGSAGPIAVTAPGVIEASRRPVITTAGVSSSAYPLIQPSEASHTTSGQSIRFATSGNPSNTSGSQPRHGNWSTGWSAKSPTLRTLNNTENYRHGTAHKRYSHTGGHPFPRTGTDSRNTDMSVFSTAPTSRTVARGGSPCQPAFQSVPRNSHGYNSVPKTTSSSASPSSSSSSCGSIPTNSANSHPVSNVIEHTTEPGRPVIAKWRRACSFYLRGHCKKEDCEFAHDLTKVTCKFWEMGECFKGPTCPFLHGYPPELTEA